MQGEKGSAEDKLRLVLVWLLTCEALPSEADMERVLASLAAAGADTTSVAYLRRMRSMKLTGWRCSCNHALTFLSLQLAVWLPRCLAFGLEVSPYIGPSCRLSFFNCCSVFIFVQCCLAVCELCRLQLCLANVSHLRWLSYLLAYLLCLAQTQ